MTATAGPGGSASCDPASVPYNGSSACTATPDAGYSFASWNGDCAGQGAACALSNIQANQASQASFTLSAINAACGSAANQATLLPRPLAFAPLEPPAA